MAKKTQEKNTKSTKTQTTQNKEEKTMKTTKIQNTKSTKKEEKNMDIKKTKAPQIEGACLILTKRGVGTVTFVQPMEHGLVNYTAYGKTARITADQVGSLVDQFKADKWEVTFRQEHIVKAPVEKKTEAQKKKSMEQRAIQKDAHTPEEKPQTRKEAMTAKYGEGYGKRWNALWSEEAAKVAEEVKKTGKRIPKSEWKKLMTERVKARLSA